MVRPVGLGIGIEYICEFAKPSMYCYISMDLEGLVLQQVCEAVRCKPYRAHAVMQSQLDVRVD